ncbi:MAG: amidophosphoribosyltransferase [Clostridiales bacterium]|jgi:amidophosphoribosyltransferase|nr:amidophosphoribosyltransferase [Clostridiales bacterium]
MHSENTMDKIREECGLFGIYKHGAQGAYLAAQTYVGLMALQHRGQEACGIAVSRQREIFYHKDMGLVEEVFDDEIIAGLQGNMAVGHVRYSTAGHKKSKANAQPLVLNYAKGQLAICHNGNIVNADVLRKEYEQGGAIYQTTTDTEVIAYTIARQRIGAGSAENAVFRSMKILRGAYSLIIMSPNKLVVARDPHGLRPLCFGMKDDGSFVFASESCALDAVDAEFVREVRPGEVIVVEEGQMRELTGHCGMEASKLCIFEYIYFARPDSTIHGQLVNDARRITGKLLAQKCPAKADIVTALPDSGVPAAMGFAEESGIPYVEGFGKNRYAGRTFIRPDQLSREQAVRLKLNPVKKYVEGKRIVVVDDSIVRGTTTSIIVKMLRDAGAAEVHLRIASPPFLYPCYYGTDVPNFDQLISHKHSVEGVCKVIGADSLAYLNLEDLPKIAPDVRDTGLCNACFTGNYPVL